MKNRPIAEALRAAVVPPASSPSFVSDAGGWRDALPVLAGERATLRELRLSDAASLLAAVGVEEVGRFISPPPPTVEGFEGFIEWSQRERQAGRLAGFGLVPAGATAAAGLIQIRRPDAAVDVAEWGFALAPEFWGTGLFVESAGLALAFAFDVMGVYRVEGRAAVGNGRGNGVLAKLGAIQEGILRRSFVRNGRIHDQALWAILESDWRRAKAIWGVRIH